MPQFIQTNGLNRGLKAVAKIMLDNCYPCKMALGFECYVELLDANTRLLSNVELEEFEHFLRDNNVQHYSVNGYSTPSTYLLPMYNNEKHRLISQIMKICTTKNHLIDVCNQKIPDLNYEPASGSRNACVIS